MSTLKPLPKHEIVDSCLCRLAEGYQALRGATHRLASRGSRKGLLIALLLALVHGVLHVYLVPPWQHYDEPGHFEYALLIANRTAIPGPDDYDPELRWQIAASMWASGFYRDLDYRPNLLSRDEQVSIGPEQLGRAPAYYLLASVPLRLLRQADVTTQLYAVRLLSLTLLLLSVTAAWGVATELVPDTHPIRWLVPLSLALLPGYVDQMTAVNNDVLVVTLFSCFLWAGLRLMRRGLSPWLVPCVLSTAVLSALTKGTGAVAIVLLPIPLIFAALRGSWRWLAWGLLLGGAVAVLVGVFAWGDAGLWYRQTLQNVPTRARLPDTPLGDHAFQLELLPGTPAPQIIQRLPPGDVEVLRGQKITLGAWIWAERPTRIRAPSLFYRASGADHATGGDIDIGQQPEFVTINSAIPHDVDGIWVGLAPVWQTGEQKLTVYYDGLVLTDGERPLADPPRFDDAGGRSGTWGGSPFVNHVRNGSAEDSWPWMRPWAVSVFGTKGLEAPVQPSLTMATLLDWPPFERYNASLAERLFRTFWAVFGWGSVQMADASYTALAGAGLAGTAGALLATWFGRRSVQWDAVTFLGLALVLVWVSTWARASGAIPYTPVYTPVARYAYPAAIPVVVLLDVGWLEILRRTGRARAVVPLLALLALDAASLVTIVQYYGGR